MRSSNYLRQAKRRQNRNETGQQINFLPNDKVVGKESLSELLDVTVTSVERWIRNGMPVEQRGDELHDWMFDLGSVREWLLQHRD